MDSIKIETKLKAEAYAITEIGGRRENQDSCYYINTPLGTVITVCDGMGGMNGGKKASSTAVTTILNTFKEADAKSDLKELIVKAIKNANDAIIAFADSNPDFAGMGTTTTVAVFNEKSAVLAHVGDSRIYQLRGRRKVFRTFDHSMVFDLVRRKVITEEQARLSEQSNVITRALGAKPSASLLVDVAERPYKKGDRFILCTDGFWGMYPEKDFLSLVKRRKNIALSDHILDIATELNEYGKAKGGGHDNLTAAFVDMNRKSTKKEKMSKSRIIILAVLSFIVIAAILALAFYFKDLIFNL